MTQHVTRCSTMHCPNYAVVDYIPSERRWWKIIRDPAPFCDDCKAKVKRKKVFS